MTKSKKFNRFLSVLLAAAMILSSGHFPVRAEGSENGESNAVTWEKVENKGNGLLFRDKKTQQVFEDTYIKDGMIRVSILLDAAPTLDKFPAYEIAANTSAKSYRQQLQKQQDAMAETISAKVLGGEKLDVVWNLTLVANIISANVPYNKIEEIKATPGVKDVVIETLYEVEEVTPGDEPNMAIASTMVGGDFAWAAGYTGAGSKVAIIDTGIDLTHELFDGAGLEYALSTLDQNVDLLTEDEVAQIWSQLNISRRVADGNGAYKSSKIPFGVNYASRNLDPSHISGTGLSGHGSHVAGIAAGNRYVSDGNGGFVASLQRVKTQGEAPDAQILAMQTFGNSGTTSDADYMVAIEDAILLGADSVNLSLGSSSAGFTVNTAYQDILDNLAKCTNLIWTGSAGNNYDWTESNLGALYDDDVNYATGGSPNTYANTLSTASIDNDGVIGVGFTANDVFVIYNESSGYSNEPMTSIAGEYEYVIINGPGVDDNNHVGQDGDQFLALVEDLGEDALKGKVAFCFRGTSSFFAKANAAIAQGAVAVVIINNQAGTINMALTGYSYKAPAVSITQAEGREIIAASQPLANNAGLDAYTGTIQISAADDAHVVNHNAQNYTMSDFSSWGVPGDLSLKPEITAPGGNIYSVDGAHYESGNVTGGPGKYTLMSGTSMAAPQMAGVVAVLAQYIRDNELVEKTGLSARQLAQSLLMSTSVPVIGEKGMYSLMKQGSGLVNINNAINARSFVTIDKVADTAPASAATSIADGKVKVELGQVLNDSVQITFSLHNFSDETTSFELEAEFFTQLVAQGYRLQEVKPITLKLDWANNAKNDKFDFNGDKDVDSLDAQFLLDVCSGLESEDNINPNSQPDIDGDGDIDTYDARLAFEKLSTATINLLPGEAMEVVLTISGLEAALGSYPNGNYIEGFIYATESDTLDGAIGITHSIPVLGFYGNWTDASMFDKGSYVEFVHGLENRFPYMAYAFDKSGQGKPDLFIVGDKAQGFLVQYAGSSTKYFFGGNPLEADKQYYPERNAISPSSVITDVQYSLIRNASARRFFITNGAGKEVAKDTLYIDGQAYGAYYYRSQSQWRNDTGATAIGYKPSGSNGTKLNLNFQAAPEYYVNRGIDWNKLGEGSIFSIPFVVDGAAPTIVDVEEEGTLLTVIAHDNEYIAAVALYTEDGKKVSHFGGLDNVRKAEQCSYEFKLDELFDGKDIPDHLLVEVYDYAANLSTYKVNFNKEELKEDVTLTLKETSVRILRGNTAQLEAVVSPWGAPDEVFWSSEDESIATVNEFGTVTAVSKGKTRIVCSYAEDPTIEAYCEVEVFLIPMTLIGVLQDETGNPLYFSWDLENDDTWTPLGDFPEGITAMTLDPTDSTHAYIQDWNGDILEVSLETDEVLNSFAGADMFGGWGPLDDMAMGKLYNEANPDAHRIYGVNNNYSGSGMLLYHHLGTETWSGYVIGGTLAGIAYEPGNGYDWYYLLDANGTMYSRAVTSDGTTYRGTTFATDLNFKVELMDGEKFSGNSMVEGSDANFYLAHFNGSTSEIYQLSYAGANVGFRSSYIGNVGDGVWPVVLLGAISNNAGAGGNNVGDVPEWHAVRDAAELVEESAIELEFVDGQLQPVGGTNAVKAGADQPAEPDKANTEVTVEITAEELSINGLITVEIPDTVTLEGYSSNAQFQSANEEATKFTFAFVDFDGFKEGETILTLKFSKGSVGTVNIVTSDINEDDENQLEETVVLGPASHSEHTYEAPVWEWNVEEKPYTATATFNCFLKDDSQVLDAVVTMEELTDQKIIRYTATVEFEGTEYTDIYEEAMPQVEINKTSLNLDGRFDVNIYITPTDDAAKAVLEFSGNGGVVAPRTEVDLTTATPNANGQIKLVVENIPSAEWNVVITLTVEDAEGNPLFLNQITPNGKLAAEGTAYEFRVVDWAYTTLETSTNEQLKDIAKAILNYGKMAQIYFDYNPNDLPQAEPLDALPVNPDYDAKMPTQEELTAMGYKKTTLNLLGTTDLRLYFDHEVTAKDENGNAYEVTGSGDNYIVVIPGIAASDLHKMFTVIVTDQGTDYRFELCALGYVNEKLKGTDNENLINLLHAIYLYNAAADAFFNP